MFRSMTLLAAMAAAMLAWQAAAVAQTSPPAPAAAPAAVEHPPDEVLAENAQTRLKTSCLWQGLEL